MNKSTLIIILFILSATVHSIAQKNVQYLQYEDLKRYHFGYFIGIHTQDLVINNSGTEDENGHKWYTETPSYSPGFNVGVIGDLRLNNSMSLRCCPSLLFGSKKVTLVSDEEIPSKKELTIKSNYFMIPVSIRYRGARTGNYRPYLSIGLSGALDMSVDKEKEILLIPVTTYLEIGFGCDFYLPYFKLVPELKFCIGLNDAMEHSRTDENKDIYLKYTNSIDKISSRLLILSFQFE